MSESEKEKIVDFNKAKAIINGELGRDTDTDNLLDALYADDKRLVELNEKHAFVDNYFGKPAILTTIYDEVTGKWVPGFIELRSFTDIYCNQAIQNGSKVTPLGEWWLKHPDRRTYSTVVFEPGEPTEYDGMYNLYRGLNVQEKRGNWKKSFGHMYRIICNSDPEKFKYFIRWLAWTLQNPNERAQVAVVIRGKKGTGKGFVFSQFVKIFGAYSQHMASMERILGRFNSQMEQCIFLFADEAWWPGKSDFESAFKQLISEPTYTVEYKGRHPKTVKNRIHMVMASNELWVVPTSADERRFFINDCDDRYARGNSTDTVRQKYFEDLFDEMNNGGREAMLYDLLRMTLRDWHPLLNVPKTQSSVTQSEISMPKYKKAVLVWLENGYLPEGTKPSGAEYSIEAKKMMSFLNHQDLAFEKVSMVKLAEIMKELKCEKMRMTRGMVYILPSLQIMRLEWNRAEGKHKWDNIEDKWHILGVTGEY